MVHAIHQGSDRTGNGGGHAFFPCHDFLDELLPPVVQQLKSHRRTARPSFFEASGCRVVIRTAAALLRSSKRIPANFP